MVVPHRCAPDSVCALEVGVEEFDVPWDGLDVVGLPADKGELRVQRGRRGNRNGEWR